MAGSATGHTKQAVDTDTKVPGDWLYMKNHDYSDIVAVRGRDDVSIKCYREKWLDDGHTYYWSGENCFYVGLNEDDEDLYEGLDLGPMTEDEMRDELMEAYNRDVEDVIDNGGRINGAVIMAITNATKAAKIKFLNSDFMRLQN